MALLPYPAPEDLEDPRVGEVLRRLPQLNLLRMEAHAEGVLECVARLSDGVLNCSTSPANLRLTAFIRLCSVVNSPYEFEQLAKVARNFGLSERKIRAAWDGSTSVDLDEQERLVARLAEQLGVQPKADRQIIEALQAFLTPRDILEIIVGIGFYLMQSRVIETLELELEDPPVVLTRPPPDSEEMRRWRTGVASLSDI